MISAHDWIDNSTIDVAVLERWPDYRVWLVATDDVDMSQLAATADDLVRAGHRLSRALDDADDHVLRWQDAYRDIRRQAPYGALQHRRAAATRGFRQRAPPDQRAGRHVQRDLDPSPGTDRW